MELVLECIHKKVGAQTWLYDMDMALHSNAVTVLLGATQAGKTSLMRIMAGLDEPTGGKVRVAFTLTFDDFAYLDEHLKPVLEPGDFKIMVGASSADIRLEKTIALA